MPKRRIESKASQTADITCACRAISFLETNPLFKSGDWVAPLLLPRKIQVILKIPKAGKMLRSVFGPAGIYAWVVARTRYFDACFEQSALQGYEQVLILGAGFDSRAVRFQQELANARVFELDAGTTQIIKSMQFRKRGVILPDNLVLIPINFEMESLTVKLEKAGFDSHKKTLVLMEGVLQYLKPENARQTLADLQRLTPRGSRLIVDYAHASFFQNGESEMLKRLKRYGESWQFGLAEEEVEPFMAGFGFKVIDRKGAPELEKDWFTDAQGNCVAKVNSSQSIITAERV